MRNILLLIIFATAVAAAANERFKMFPEQDAIVINEGDTLDIKCVLEDFYISKEINILRGRLSFVGRRNMRKKKIFSPVQKGVTLYDNGLWLRIENATIAEDAGYYLCQSDNYYEEIMVTVKPVPVIRDFFCFLYVPKWNLSCSYAGDTKSNWTMSLRKSREVNVLSNVDGRPLQPRRSAACSRGICEGIPEIYFHKYTVDFLGEAMEVVYSKQIDVNNSLLKPEPVRITKLKTLEENAVEFEMPVELKFVVRYYRIRIYGMDSKMITMRTTAVLPEGDSTETDTLLVDGLEPDFMYMAKITMRVSDFWSDPSFFAFNTAGFLEFLKLEK